MSKETYSFWRSLRHALAGLRSAFQSEKHIRVHVVATIAVAIGLLWKQPSATGCLFVVSAVALVWLAELVNTAIEKTVDLAQPSEHPLAKQAKDVAAAAVLIASLYAVVVGLIVFLG
jgi:diacylglycerol kinase